MNSPYDEVMTGPEIPGGGIHSIFSMEKLKEFFQKLFFQKKQQEEIQARENQQKMRQAERRESREEADREKKRKDEQRSYRNRVSGETRVEPLSAARQARLEQIKKNLEKFIDNQAKDKIGAGYYLELVRDTGLRDRLYELIDSSPNAANLLDKLAIQGKELHGNPVALINLARGLLYEVQRVPGGREAVVPLLEAMKSRALDLIPEVISVKDQESRLGKDTQQDWLVGGLNLQIPENQKQGLSGDSLRNQATREAAINQLFSTSPEVAPSRDTRWTEVNGENLGAGSAAPPQQLVQEVDEIWGEVQQSEQAGSHLSVDQLQNIERRLLSAVSKGLPKDVIPGTQAYNNVVVASRRFTEEKLTALANQLSERLKMEAPLVKSGKTNPADFLKEMVLHPGRLGELLQLNPEMRNLLVGHVPKADMEKSRHFRDQVFLTIHQAILTDKNVSSNDNFGLYERADFTTFSNIIRNEMANLIRPETGIAYGQTWVDWYVNLSNTIRLSRDIDFWAAQPGANIDDFNKSLALFQNSSSVQALTLPAVEQAYRAYETSLRSIRNSNDGYIPPSLVGYDATHMDSYWDRSAQQMLEKMIKQKVVFDVERDEHTGFHVIDKDGNTVKINKNNPLNLDKLKKEDPQDLELSMYMTLAKGFGLASLRYLEMFANSKVPGSGQPGFAMGNFHSTPYEGPARALNYMATVIHKWRFGSYKYLHMMNTLLPEEHKIRHIDKDASMRAYIAYRDGTFTEKYGHEAKRMIDKLNFSGGSSAFGPPGTQWRHMDTTIGWSDKERELLGGPTMIMFSSRFAGEKVKEYFVVGKYREMFRDAMRNAGQPTSGTEFDRLWQERGLEMYSVKIESDWDKLRKDKRIDQKIKEMTKSYKKAFVARVWVEMAMRNPLAVTHNLEIPIKDVIGNRKIRLHSYLVQEVLGIPLEDTKYGEVAGKAAYGSSPTEKQRAYMNEVMDLEGDLAAVRELAIENNRELTPDDFNIIKSDKNRAQALEYWKMTKEILMGGENYGHLYEQFGLKLAENGHDYDIDWEKIKNIEQTLEHLGGSSSGEDKVAGGKILLNEALVDKDWDINFGSDDTAFRKMALLNLGARQWVRRGGDAAAHYHGGERVGKYLSMDIIPNPDTDNLAKALLEIRNLYEGDAIENGWQVAGLLAHATSRLYSLDISRLGSAAQLDVWHTRRGVAAWTANGRRKFWDSLEHLDVLPPVGEAGSNRYGIQGSFDLPHDIHELRKLNRAANIDVWTEILLYGLILALVIQIWTALKDSAKDEDEGGGGGGHH